MLNLKTIFDVVESPVEVRLVSRDSLSPDLPEQADPLFDEIQATPDAGAPRDSGSRLSNPERGLGWPKDVAVLVDFVLLLSVDDLPPAPFDFGSGATVVDAAMFLRWLQADVRRGPKARWQFTAQFKTTCGGCTNSQ